MRYPPDQKQKTRERILAAAAVVFRRLGYQGGGVDAVMREAGLTSGGFYSHFASKEALFAETLPHALKQTRTLTGPDFDHLSGPEWVRAVAERYLSPGHRRLVDQGCPLPALLPEVARASRQSRQAFENVLREVVASVASRLGPAGDRPAIDQALALLSLLVGGMMLARAVADETLADQILAACRAFIDAGLAEVVKSSPETSKRSAGTHRQAARRKKGETPP
jgi:AcrR family transcriptional regulator